MRRALLVLLLFLGVLVSSYFALEAFATAKIKEKLDRRLSKLPYAVSYSDIKYNLALNDLVLYDFTLNGNVFKLYLGKVVVDLPSTFRKKAFPPELHLIIKDGTLSVYFPIFDFLSDSPIRFNLAGGYSFHENQLTGYLYSSLEEIGDFHTEFLLDNLSYTVMERFFEGRTTYRSIVNRAKLEYFKFTFKNRGLVEKFLNYAAKEEGTNVESVKEELKNMVRNGFTDKSIYERIGKPLEEFIDNPKCLSIEVKPKTPVGLKEIEKLLIKKPDILNVIDEFGIELKNCPNGRASSF